MKLEMKLDPETNAPVMNEAGAIVFIDIDDGDKEMPLDPVQMYGKISSLNKENKTHRETNKTLTTTVALFEGVEDIADWKKTADEALTKVANWKDADYVKAEKVEKLKLDITSAYDDKLAAKDTAISEQAKSHAGEVEKLNGQIRKLMVSNMFSSSKYFGPDSLTTIEDPAIAESFFGKNFKVEVDDTTGEPITRAYFNNGDQVLSKVNPGEPAEFEEAIGIIIDDYPGRDAILRSSGGGSGGKGGSEGIKGQSDLQTLKKQYSEAVEAKNTQLAITLKNQIFREEQKLRKN